jgi:hypothetical protein
MANGRVLLLASAVSWPPNSATPAPHRRSGTPIVPCRRVVGTSGSLTGYAGGLHRKWFLLSPVEPPAAEDGRLF